MHAYIQSKRTVHVLHNTHTTPLHLTTDFSQTGELSINKWEIKVSCITYLKKK